jgi:uncharacterized protein (TIGR03435 family)
MRRFHRWGIAAGVIAIAAVAAIAAICTLAQAPAPRFQIVAIKPVAAAEMGNGSFHGMGAVDPTRWRAQALTLSPLVASAYGIPWAAFNRALGLPDWALKTAYDIDAVLPPHTRRAQVPLMVRAMLADRFKMEAHLETRPLRAVALRVAKRGAQLIPDPACGRADLPLTINAALAGNSRQALRFGRAPTAAPACGEARRTVQGGMIEIRFRGMSMAQLADYAATSNLPVIDATGLKGTFDFSVRYPAISGPNAADAQAQAYFNQLGLILNRQRTAKLPVPVVVVDRIAPPTPN